MLAPKHIFGETRLYVFSAAAPEHKVSPRASQGVDVATDWPLAKENETTMIIASRPQTIHVSLPVVSAQHCCIEPYPAAKTHAKPGPDRPGSSPGP